RTHIKRINFYINHLYMDRAKFVKHALSKRRQMPMIDRLLWVIFPYVCIVVLVLGHIFRYRYDQFGWTAKSSEFFEKKRLIVGSLMFHLGIIPVFLGHVSGLGIPKTWTRALGISDELYHFGAVYGGGF